MYRPKVDHVVVNKYWGLGTPDYSLVAGLKKPDYVGPRLALLEYVILFLELATKFFFYLRRIYAYGWDFLESNLMCCSLV